MPFFSADFFLWYPEKSLNYSHICLRESLTFRQKPTVYLSQDSQGSPCNNANFLEQLHLWLNQLVIRLLPFVFGVQGEGHGLPRMAQGFLRSRALWVLLILLVLDLRSTADQELVVTLCLIISFRFFPFCLCTTGQLEWSSNCALISYIIKQAIKIWVKKLYYKSMWESRWLFF